MQHCVDAVDEFKDKEYFFLVSCPLAPNLVEATANTL